MDTTDKDNLGQEPLVYPSLQGKNLLSHSTSWCGLGWVGPYWAGYQQGSPVSTLVLAK